MPVTCPRPNKQILKYYLPTIEVEPENSETQMFNWQNGCKPFYVKASFKGEFECVYFNASATFKLVLDKDDHTQYKILDVCIHNIRVEDEDCVDASDKTDQYGYLYCLDDEPCHDRAYYKQLKKRIYNALKCFIDDNMTGERNDDCESPLYGKTTLTLTLENTPKEENCVIIVTPNFTRLSAHLELTHECHPCKPCKPHKPCRPKANIKLFVIITILLALILMNLRKIKLIEILGFRRILKKLNKE